MPKDAYYFPHDSNAKDDPKITLLIDELQLEGYGIYWVLIETLRDQENFKYPIRLLPSLARKYNTSSKKMEAVVKGYGLFGLDNDSFFFSPSLTNRMLKVNERRAALSEAGKRGNEKRWGNAIALPSGGDPNLIAVKESKEKKRKEKKIKEESIIAGEPAQNNPILKSIPKTKEEKKEERVLRELEFGKNLIPYIEAYSAKVIRDFFDYWREPNPSGFKMKFEMEKTWDLSLRIAKWQNNNDKWNSENKTKTITNEQQSSTDKRILEKLNRPAAVQHVREDSATSD